MTTTVGAENPELMGVDTGAPVVVLNGDVFTDGAGKCAAAGKSPYTVQYFADTAPIFLGLANGKVDIYFGPTLSLKYDAAHIPNTKFLSQFSSTPVGFVTGKGSPIAPALTAASEVQKIRCHAGKE